MLFQVCLFIYSFNFAQEMQHCFNGLRSDHQSGSASVKSRAVCSGPFLIEVSWVTDRSMNYQESFKC